MDARKFSTNFCDIVVLWQQCSLPQDNGPDLSGVPLLSSMPLPPPPFSTPFPPIFSAPLFSPFFRLAVQTVSFIPAVRAGFLLQHVFWLIQSHIAHHPNWKG